MENAIRWTDTEKEEWTEMVPPSLNGGPIFAIISLPAPNHSRAPVEWCPAIGGWMEDGDIHLFVCELNSNRTIGRVGKKRRKPSDGETVRKIKSESEPAYDAYD
ncbi:uncharacterized protein ZHAS_00016538 [Anopheles sinensis]|uniref:Uncharacterized protein n=1 Tax=Anopheles sinensis TaxID=74873 RepID=A0A084WDW9_ANOSI|nr:uncharacterized protein ZHAS_00016538 [Anopheles sinensis]